MPIFEYVSEQYQLVQSSRTALFDYCKTVSINDFVNENSSFGRGGSMRNLLVHVANVYEFWIANKTLNKAIIFTSYPSQ